MSELYHYGVLGMKWGVRHYQNKDGTLTAAGRKRYGVKVESTSNTTTWKIHHDGKTFSSEKEYNDWVAAGKPKRKNWTETYTNKVDQHKFTKKGKSISEIDELGKKDELYSDKFDSIGNEAVKAYNKGGTKAVKNLLKSYGDYKLDLVINDDKIIETGEKYVTYALKAYGKEYVYNSYGEEDYSDEQWFQYTRKAK